MLVELLDKISFAYIFGEQTYHLLSSDPRMNREQPLYCFLSLLALTLGSIMFRTHHY